MGKLKWVISLATVLLTSVVHAQEQNNVQPDNNNTNQEVATPQNADTDAQQSPADTPGAADAANNANANNNGNSNTSEGAVSNAPAVSQTTTSQSGSPAVLSSEDGKGRDGTNNVQRATMNMAGSPATNLNLDENQPENANEELRDRQSYSQEKQISAGNQNQQGTGNPSSGESSEINEKSRKENNALSDQNLSAKDKDASSSENPKSDKKPNKKKRDRG